MRNWERRSSNNSFWQTLHRTVSMVMAVVMLVSGAVPVGAVEDPEGISAGTAADSEAMSVETAATEEQEPAYQQGYVNMYFPEAESRDVVKVPVLFDEETESVWVNGEVFTKYFNHYTYQYESEKRKAILQSRNKAVAFSGDSYAVYYGVDQWESYFTMEEDSLIVDDTFWIPADAFFYCLGVSAVPVIGQLEDGSWDVENDFLYVTEPANTIQDILIEVFSYDNGQQWMFTYEKDFGFDQDGVDDLMKKAKVVLDIYGTLTGDFERIFSWTSELRANISDAICRIFDKDLDDRASFYDAQRTEKFLERMLYISSEQLSLLESDTEMQLQVVGDLSERVFDIWEKYIGKDTAAFAAELCALTSGDFAAVGEKVANEYTETIKTVLKEAEPAKTAVTVSAKVLSALITISTIKGNIERTDETMLEAVSTYVKNAAQDNELGSGMYGELQVQVMQNASKIFYAMDEALESAMTDVAPGIVMKAAGMSAVGIATAGTNLIMYLEQRSGILPWMASKEQIEALELAMYSITYQADAWRELIQGYDEAVLIGEFSDYGEVRKCALLALNYLKACYVSTEAGLKSWENSSEFDEGGLFVPKTEEDFTESVPYRNTQEKLQTLAEMIDDLTRALMREESYLGTGVMMHEPENKQVIEGMELLDFSSFIGDTPIESGVIYGVGAEELNAPEFEIYPLIQMQEEILNNGGTVVKYGDYLYYWEYQVANHESATLYPKFAADVTAGSDVLMRKGPDGTAVSIASVYANPGEIYILNDTIFIEGKEGKLYSYDLEGKRLQTYEEVSQIAGMDEEGKYLIGDGYDGIFSICAESGERISLSEPEYDDVILIDGETVYYSRYDTDIQSFLIYCCNADGTETGKIGSVSHEVPDSIHPAIVSAQIVGDYLYLLEGTYQGSMSMFGDAYIHRISLEESSCEMLQYIGWSDAFFVKENEKGEAVLYYCRDGNYTMAWCDNTHCIDGPVQYQNLTTGETGTADIPIAQMGNPFLTTNSCKAYLFFVKNFSLFSPSKFPVFTQGNSLHSAGYLCVSTHEGMFHTVAFSLKY